VVEVHVIASSRLSIQEIVVNPDTVIAQLQGGLIFGVMRRCTARSRSTRAASGRVTFTTTGVRIDRRRRSRCISSQSGRRPGHRRNGTTAGPPALRNAFCGDRNRPAAGCRSIATCLRARKLLQLMVSAGRRRRGERHMTRFSERGAVARLFSLPIAVWCSLPGFGCGW